MTNEQSGIQDNFFSRMGGRYETRQKTENAGTGAARKEAVEKILLINSQYGKMTNHSLEDFLAENDLDLPELQDELELPSIDLEYFRDSDFQAVSAEEQRTVG